MIPTTTLFSALRRAYLASSALGLVLLGLSLALITFVVLRTQVTDNLDLVARTIAYSSEAAVMFGDDETATEILTQIATRENLSQASLFDASGHLIAHVERPAGTFLERVGIHLGGFLFPEQTKTDLIRAQQHLGRIELRGGGGVFAGFFLKALMATLACLCIAGLSTWALARRMATRIMSQLDALGSIAHTALQERDFERRLPTFDIVEFDQLAKDFNALLGEIQAKNAALLVRQSHLEQTNMSLSHLAMHDSLTGLANRAGFSARINQAIADARQQGALIGVLYLDNDRFKSINDRFGHAAGDALLIEVGLRIRRVLREGDLVARLGGDEFAVLLSPLRCADDAVRIAEKILASMTEPMVLNENTQIDPGVSIGVALYPDHAQNADQLLRAADKAMYEAKRSGRGQYRVHGIYADPTEEHA